ncbi:MAG: outer membrane protein [Puniceicoccaceae bacterium]
MKTKYNTFFGTTRFPAVSSGTLKYAMIMVLGLLAAHGSNGSTTGWGARLFTGLDFGQTDTIKANLNGIAASEKVDLDSGILFGGAVDYTWNNGFTAELEYTYRSADFSNAPTDIFPDATEADIASVLIFANFLYRPAIESMPRLQPRLGIGIGWLQETSLDVMTDGMEESFDGSGEAYQLIVGADYSLTENWQLGLNLHWYSAGSVDLKGETDSQRKLDVDYEGFSLIASVGYRF